MKKVLILTVFLLFVNGVVWAESVNVYNAVEGVYLGLSAQYLRLDLPDYSPIALEDSSFNFITYLDGSDGREEAVMPGVIIGFPIPALNIVVEFGAEVADWNSETNKIYDYSSSYRVGYLSLDGNHGTVGVSSGGDVAARINRSGDYSRFELIGKYPMHLKGLEVIPFVGPSFMSLEEDFALRANSVQVPSYQLLQDEQLDSDYIGARLGIKLAGRFCDFAGWELTPAIGVYHLDADYKGSQQESVIGYTATIKDGKSRTTTAASVLGKIVLEYQQLTLSFVAGLDYLEDVAKIRHSTLGNGSANNYGDPAHIEFDSSLNSRFGVELGVKFW
ncbi:MAG: hypothetical protein AB7D06_11905 [Pedobacter sp.]